MRLKTARKGRNPGAQFFGCSNYPRCRGTVDVAGDESRTIPLGPDGNTSLNSGPPTSPFDLPRDVVVAPRHAGWQTKVFQSAALPSQFVGAVHANDTARAVVRNFSHWRLDYPWPKAPGRNNALQSVLAVAEALLSRGALPLCGRATERLLIADETEFSTDWLSAALLGVALAPTIPFEQTEFAGAEREFMKWVVDETEFHARGWSVMPQINLGSLAFPGESEPSERVDFVFVHPTAGALVVEVDGPDHDQHSAVDKARDASLWKVVIASIRVPTRELEVGQGANLEAVRSRLMAESYVVRSADWAVLRMAKFAHQVQCALLEALRGGWLIATEIWDVAVMLPTALGDMDNQLAIDVVASAVRELRELVMRLSALHELAVEIGTVTLTVVRDREVEAAVLIAPATLASDGLHTRTGAGRFLISDTPLAVEVAAPLTAAPPLRLKEPARGQAEWFLNYLFRKESFLEGQETVERALGQGYRLALPERGSRLRSN